LHAAHRRIAAHLRNQVQVMVMSAVLSPMRAAAMAASHPRAPRPHGHIVLFGKAI